MTSPNNKVKPFEAPSTQNTDRYNQETYKTILNSQIINNSQSRQNSESIYEQQQLFQSDNYTTNTPKKYQRFNREQFLKSNELLKHKQLNLSETNLNISGCKSSSSQQLIKINDLECKYCSQIDQYVNFIRPCLCKGSMQHVHQTCVQKDIESNFMDQSKRRFIKPIQCEICKFEYLIKIYKNTSFSQSFKDPIKHDKIVFLTFILTILALISIGLIVLSILLQDILKMRIDLLISIIIAALIIFGLIVAFTLNLIDLMTNYYWYVLDRNENKKEDGGVKVDYHSLNIILMTGSLRYKWDLQKVFPVKE